MAGLAADSAGTAASGHAGTGTPALVAKPDAGCGTPGRAADACLEKPAGGKAGRTLQFAGGMAWGARIPLSACGATLAGYPCGA